ncbi:MAG: TRAP transporter large permease [Spirochaetia bacterium]|jgi:tripartite ATP-independent transporter DctM subunit|nr:TRAP transporter large permease [Spirochaetia bacterium]
MTPTLVGIIGIAALFVLIFSRMPIGFLIAIIGAAGFGVIVTGDAALNLLAKDFFSVFASHDLTVIPLFVLMGQVAFHAGISSRLFDTAYRFIGHLPGGLAMATVGACAAFSAVCGSTNATAATMAAATLPEMKRYNYKPGLATGVVAAGGSLGILIPPSVIFIVYGILTEQSIGKLFMAGVIPGLLLVFLFVITILIWATIDPELGPAGPKATWKERFKSLQGVFETLLIFIVVLGGLFLGFFTPTEAGAIGAFSTILMAVVRGTLTWDGFISSLFETTRTTCMIMIIVAGATVFGHFLAVSRIPYDIASWISAINLPATAIICIIILIYMLGGCFIDSLALIMLTVPIFYPVILHLGFDPIWFGVIIVMVSQIGVLTPPVGVSVYVVSGVARNVPLQVIFKGVIPFIIALVVGMLLVIAFPQIVLFLPNLIH